MELGNSRTMHIGKPATGMTELIDSIHLQSQIPMILSELKYLDASPKDIHCTVVQLNLP